MKPKLDMFIEFSLLLDDTSGSIKNGYFESVFSNISRTYSTRLLENAEAEITPEEWTKIFVYSPISKIASEISQRPDDCATILIVKAYRMSIFKFP